MHCSIVITADDPARVAKAMEALARWAEGWAAEGVYETVVRAGGEGYDYEATLSRETPEPEPPPPADPAPERLPRPADPDT